MAARPSNLKQVDASRTPQSKVHSQICLRKMTAPAAHLIELLVITGYAADARPDRAAIRFGSHQFQFNPIIPVGAGAHQEPGNVIDWIDKNIDRAVVIEVAERTATAHNLRIEGGSHQA